MVYSDLSEQTVQRQVSSNSGLDLGARIRSSLIKKIVHSDLSGQTIKRQVSTNVNGQGGGGAGGLDLAGAGSCLRTSRTSSILFRPPFIRSPPPSPYFSGSEAELRGGVCSDKKSSFKFNFCVCLLCFLFWLVIKEGLQGFAHQKIRMGPRHLAVFFLKSIVLCWTEIAIHFAGTIIALCSLLLVLTQKSRNLQ